jgi:excinuclease ABC subunit C
MTREEYKLIAPGIPDQPGVYHFIDKDASILYIGKAKNLKKRLNSYFSKNHGQYGKTITMLRHARNIEYILVESEVDALLLESALIKKHQPRYNVMLKDGKSYGYICLKNERFPRVFYTRKVIRDGSQYFGPYTSKLKADTLLDLIHRIFQLRTCSYNLSVENVAKKKYSVCLEYHIKNCLGPCEGFETEEAYNQKINQVTEILKGKFKNVRDYIKRHMTQFALDLEYEKAQLWKNKFEALVDYQSKSAIVNASIRDVDVFSISETDKKAFVNYIKVIDGTIINTFTEEMTKNLNTNPIDLLRFAIQSVQGKVNSKTSHLILPFRMDLANEEIKITVPQRGDKKKLLDLSQKNADFFRDAAIRDEQAKKRSEVSIQRKLNSLKDDLHMEEPPWHIECFDNSNIQGSHPVASCVVFKNARPFKKDYRHFKIKTVTGPDDFASMTEVVYRRYSRLIREKAKLPQLIVIDGGKGQLSASVESLEKLGLMDQITVIGIAKKLEEIYLPGDSLPLYIDKKSESLKIIQQIRNEAHRFAITFHRDQRSKDFAKSSLSRISGIGPKTEEKLLQNFGSIEKIKKAKKEEVVQLVGLKKAELIIKALSE